MANSPPATATEVHQRKDTKSLWGSPSEFVILTAANGLLSLLTALPGAIMFTSLSLPSRPPAKKTWERNAAGGRSEQLQQLHQSRARPLTAATAAGPACPVLDLLVISVPAIGVDTNLYLIFVSEVKPRICACSGHDSCNHKLTFFRVYSLHTRIKTNWFRIVLFFLTSVRKCCPHEYKKKYCVLIRFDVLLLFACTSQKQQKQ